MKKLTVMLIIKKVKPSNPSGTLRENHHHHHHRHHQSPSLSPPATAQMGGRLKTETSNIGLMLKNSLSSSRESTPTLMRLSRSATPTPLLQSVSLKQQHQQQLNSSHTSNDLLVQSPGVINKTSMLAATKQRPSSLCTTNR